MNKKLDFQKGAIPLYLQIKKILKTKIESGKYAYGEVIPSELQLQYDFDVSRITVRQAIVDLEREGYLERKRGKGTTVIYQPKIEEELLGIVSFTEEMKSRGLTPGTSYAHIEKVKVDKDVATILKIKENSEALLLKRVRTSNDIPMAYFETYFVKGINLPLKDKQYYGSLYELMEKNGIEKPSSTTERISAGIAKEDIAKRLDIKKNAPVLIRSRVSYSKNQDVIEYTTVYYPASRYSYIINSFI